MTDREITNSASCEKNISESFLLCCQEFVGQYKKLFKPDKKKRLGLYHLYALDHLCQFGEHMGLDCNWIYHAFVDEMKSKKKTILNNYYVGGFIASLVDYGCTEAAAIQETAYWLGRSNSQSKVRDAYKSFLHLSANYAPLELAVLFKHQKLRIAAAVINNVAIPFGERKPAKGSKQAYDALHKDIQKCGFQNEISPIKIIIKKNK